MKRVLGKGESLTRRDFLKVGGGALAGTSLLGLAGCGSAGSGGSGSRVTLRLAHNLPEQTPTGRGMSDFAEAVEQKSNGQIQVEVFPAGQLYSDTAMIDAIPGGSVDMGMVNLGQWSGVVPVSQLFEVPFLFNTYEKVHAAVDGEIGNILEERLREQGDVTPVMWVDYGYGELANNQRPVRLPEDLQGMRVRSSAELGAEAYEAMGAGSVTMGGAEVYTALERGTIEGANTGLSSMDARQYAEVTDYVTIARQGFGMFAVFANPASFDQLSSEQREAVMEASNEVRDSIREDVQETDEAARASLQEQGMEIYEVPQEDLAEWREATAPVQEIYLESTGETGAELLEIAEEL